MKVGDYMLYKLLGKGSFGEVYLTKKGNNPEILATKKLDKKQTDRPSIKKYFDNEISIMKELNHPNIVRFYDMLVTNSHYYVVMEYCNGGDLLSCLDEYKKLYNIPFTQEIVQYLMRQIVEGLKMIHSHKIIHRDIKLDNILLKFEKESDKNNLNMLAANVKIIDFGLATRLGPEDLTFTALGSPINMDPIILQKYKKAGGYEQLQGYNEKADIWSLGTICYELLTGEKLFKVKDIKDLMTKVESGNYAIPININFSKEAVSFLNSMLQYNANDRLSADELSKHDFLVKDVNDFSQVDLKIISNKIDKNGLNINVKANQTIWDVFNENLTEDSKKNPVNPTNNKNIQNNQNNQSNKINQNNPNSRYSKYSENKNKHKSPLQARRNTKEQNYVFSNNIYNYANNKNNNGIENNNANQRKDEENLQYNNNYAKIPINMNRPLENNMNRNRFTEGYISPQKKSDKNIIKNNCNRKDSDTNEKEKKEILIYMNGLLQEYKKVWEYFKINELKKQEEDANIKYYQIKNAFKQVEQGLPIKYNSLPKPITPEYIYGYSKAERDSIFKEIISLYTNKKNEIEIKIKDALLKFQKLDSVQMAKIQNKIQPEMEKEKVKLAQIKKFLEKIEQMYKNKWVPAPKIIKDLEIGKNNQISNENDYQLKIHIGKTDYTRDNLALIIKFVVSKDKILRKEVKLKKIGDFDEDILWSLSPIEWNNVDCHLILEYYYVEVRQKVAVKLNISNIKDSNELFYECPINLYPDNTRVIINLDIKVFRPNLKKAVEQGKKEVISVKKIYPAFEGKSPETNNIPSLFSN